jgi:hypothetical protein
MRVTANATDVRRIRTHTRPSPDPEGSPTRLSYARTVSEFPFNMFGGGDPEELQRAMAQFMEQAQQGQRVAFADQAINLAVGMTVAAIGRLDVTGTADQQANQVRDAIRLIFPEAVTLVREAREGLA